jgi:hypothetical protein
MKTAVRLAGIDADLARRALDVLEANWLGHATRPSPRLYPHQWSWDSACIAMGYAGWDQARAEAELRSLFAAQWGNGLLPHIVFTDAARYFPGPDFWQTERSAHAPRRPRTSGIVQPPIHATAAWRVYRAAADGQRAAAFLAELMPRLVAWHEYLYRERTRGDERLAEIWHPWESGMDNSPLWDDALARIVLDADDVPAYRRVDVEVANAAERPTDAEYDRYAYLVQLFRDLSYRQAEIRKSSPFAVQPVLFNSLLVESSRDLAAIARALGTDPEPFEAWADRTAADIDAKLWDERQAMYLDFDVRAGEPVRTRSATGFAPLYAGVPSTERAERMVERLMTSAVRVGKRGRAVASLSPDDPRFEPTLYWRGPVWPILNWVVCRGLARYGFSELAQEFRIGLIDLCRRNGFWEHYSPETGRGHGGEQFAWTAGLVLDLLRDEQDEKGGVG